MTNWQQPQKVWSNSEGRTWLSCEVVGSFLCRSAVSSQEMCYASHGLLSVCVDVAEGKLYHAVSHVLTKSSSPEDGRIQTQWVDRLKCNWMNYGRNPPPEKLAISGRFRMVKKRTKFTFDNV